MALPTSVQIVPGHMVLSGNVHTNDTSDTFCIDHTNGIVGIGQSLTNLVNDSNVLQISGRVHATRYYGDGSQLTGLTDSKWIEDENDINNIYYSAGNVGIGGAVETEKLTVHGSSHMKSSLANGNVGMIAGNSDRQWRVGIRGDTNDDFAIQDDTEGQMRLRINSSGNVGIGGNPGTEKLKVHGDILATANVTAYSDRRLKSDIVKIKDALNKIDKLNGYTYTMNDKRSTGLIAQEVLEVLPEAVEGSEETTYALAYGNLASIFVEAIKELREKVLDLENKIQN